MSSHNPRCAMFRDPPSLRDANACNCGAIPPLPTSPSAGAWQRRAETAEKRVAELEVALEKIAAKEPTLSTAMFAVATARRVLNGNATEGPQDD